MTEREMINTPSLAGWAIACAAGAFVFGVAFVAMGLGFMQAAFVAALVLVVVGVILGLMHDPLPPLGAASAEAPVAHGAAHAAPVAKVAEAVAAAPVAVAPVAAAPMAAAVEAALVAAPVAAAPAPVEAAPAPAAQPLMAAADAPAAQPRGLAAARDGKADDLKTIEGIGPVLEKLCHDLGIFHFDQIAAWGPAEVAWMDSNLKGFKGRVTRDKWVAQAKIICTDGIEAFRVRAKTNDY